MTKNDSPQSPAVSVKCVFVGDSGVGKSSLVNSFLFPEGTVTASVPTVRDDYTYATTTQLSSGESKKGGGSVSVDVDVDVDLDICDTGGEKYLDRLRPLCYNNTDIAVICFSVVIPSSFANVTKRWVPELKRHCLTKKIILVATQSDLRSSLPVLLQLMDEGLVPVSEKKGLGLARKIGAVKYLECSSRSGYNVKKILDTVIHYGALSSGIPLPRRPSLTSGSSSSSSSGSEGTSSVKTMTTSGSNRNQNNKRWKLFKKKSQKIKRLMVPSCFWPLT